MISVRKPSLWAGGAVGFCLISSLALSQSAFDQRWPATANSSDWALAYAKPAQTPDPFRGLTFKPPMSLPAESGVNYELSPFSGYVNLGSGTDSQTTAGTSGSVAFPLGHSFGLLSNLNAASVGGYGLYQGGSNFYWRDPGLGLIGATGQVGHVNSSFGSANFAAAGANFESYLDRFTLFATAGAFGAQSLATSGYGTIGAAYYPTDNLLLSLSGYDYGGISGVQGGVEYLLPQKVNGVATTISANGFVGNHETSGAMARLKFLFGPTPANNKTLIERRRQDGPWTDDPDNVGEFARVITVERTKDFLGAPLSFQTAASLCPANTVLPDTNTCTCPLGTLRIIQPPASFVCS